MEQIPIEQLLEFSIINIDKPAGITSFKTVDIVRKILGAKKTGHTGTLDPMVTGVLPVLINRATKLSDYFMKKDKKYVGKMHINEDISEADLKKEMGKFVGKIMQKPPVKSRVKRVLREREVKEFKFIKKEGKTVSFESDVQAGTYIRKLIHDLGEKIGGAHMTDLRRTRAGFFNVDESVSLEELREAFAKYEKGDESVLREMLIPAEIVRRIVGSVQVKEGSLFHLLNGRLLVKDYLKSREKVPDSDVFSVFCGERFVGIYRKICVGDDLGKAEKILGDVDKREVLGKAEFVMN